MFNLQKYYPLKFIIMIFVMIVFTLRLLKIQKSKNDVIRTRFIYVAQLRV